MKVNWFSLFGKEESDPDFDFLKDFKLSDINKFEKDGLIYRNYKTDGLSLCFKHGKLDSVFFYNNNDGFGRYKYELPYGIKMDMYNSDIVKKLGEPEGKAPGNQSIPIFIDYKKLGLQIDFLTKQYEDKKNPITCICLYPPEK